ncbi:MAG TPA: SpoIID/LytB domain-containing protein [Solirubrobacteraceae bacterium]|jgi:stage II sporulation protein D|nr:SpoIID/LytB domain-containing protein [Solirubrobacteraceae bacterium]
MKALVCLTLAALAVAPAPAGAASRLTVRGAGFGHGVGMSQYGAFGYASRGNGHAFILNHYYAGTQLGKLGGPTSVRVLLRRASRATFSGATAVAGGRSLDPALTYAAVPALGATVALRSPTGRDLGTYESPLRVTGAGAGVQLRGRAANGVTSGRYRGDLELRAGALGGISAINVVDLEDYVRGVVAGEVPAAWPDEALRAQAVAARTYALTTSKNGDGFDQYADTRSQMYPGMSGEDPRTDAAVAATAREIVVYEGKPIVTYYFSTSGGRTENVENSFLGAQPAPYLTSVEDPYDGASPRHRWTVRLTLRQADARLGSLVKGRLRQIKVLARGRSPRVVRAQVVGTGGRSSVTGPQLRSKLGLYDTWARFTVITSGVVRGDASKPKAPASGEPGTGGATPRSVLAGASLFADAREASRAPVVATIAGRVAPATAGEWVELERRVADRWRAQFETPVLAGGRYRAGVRESGMWRVRFGGETGPPVRVRFGGQTRLPVRARFGGDTGPPVRVRFGGESGPPVRVR